MKRKKFRYRGCDMASRSEVRFAEDLDSSGITWMYEPEALPWIPPKRKYTPDFKILRKDGSYFYVEYKGYLRPSDKTKMIAIKKQYPHIDIRFIFENEKKPSYKGASTNYADWAEKNGFKWAQGSIPKKWIKETH